MRLMFPLLLLGLTFPAGTVHAYQAVAVSAAVERPAQQEAALRADEAAQARCERSLRRGPHFGPGAAEARLAALTCVGVTERPGNAARARCERSLRRGPYFGPGAAEARLAALTCVGVTDRPVAVRDIPG